MYPVFRVSYVIFFFFASIIYIVPLYFFPCFFPDTGYISFYPIAINPLGVSCPQDTPGYNSFFPLSPPPTGASPHPHPTKDSITPKKYFRSRARGRVRALPQPTPQIPAPSPPMSPAPRGHPPPFSNDSRPSQNFRLHTPILPATH